MFIARFLRPEHIRLGLENGHVDQMRPDRDPLRERQRLKEAVIAELVSLFAATGQIRNEHKFFLDLLNREKRASTAVGHGIAFPHLRSMQPRSLAVVFARSREGVEFDSPDGEPVHVFFGLAAPPYDDRTFLQFYRWVSQSFLQEDWLLGALLEAEDEHEIIAILSGLQ